MSGWQAALEAYEMARTDLAECGSTDVEADFYTDAQFTALDTLMTTPAPDAGALARKLEIFFAEECGAFGEDWRLPMQRSLLGDARRLLTSHPGTTEGGGNG